ncbi:MAG: hypothetical protein MUE42_07300 [Opitutaceae bacterium]|jgi:hypothetical protein|nr:hypothetical protein [Opitutaceae bacterium]
MSDLDLDRLPIPDAHASYRLYRFGVAGLVATFSWFLYQTGGDVGMHTVLGLGILLLASVPALQWALRARTWFPAFEISMLTCVAFYAFPLLSNHAELAHYSDTVINEAGLLVLFYLGTALMGFSSLRQPPRPPSWVTTSLLPEQAYRYISGGMLLNTCYLYIVNFTSLIPGNLTGTFRALFFGVGILATFVLARLWGLERLPRKRVIFVCVNLTLQVILLFSQLYLISGISLLALALIAYASARRKVPWLVVVAILPILGFLHLGKSEMRRQFWEEKRPAPTPLELPAFFQEWFTYSVAAKEEDETRSSLVERASLIQMLCLSVDRVPSIRPYLNGESYVDIPAQFIPRPLWPGKPSSLLANIRLAIHFNLVDPDDPYSVSIAFGIISEAYVNFGLIGVLLLGFMFGLVFKYFALLSQSAPQFSAVGIFMILLTAWSFQAELVLATWLASLFQAAVVCVGIPLGYRFVTNR